MKKLLLIGLFGYLFAAGPGLAPTASFIDGSVISENKYFDMTLTKTYTNRYCYRGYMKIKKELKNRAKVYCADRGWAYKLYNKHFYKISCEKIKRKHHKTKVKVTASLNAMCIN